MELNGTSGWQLHLLFIRGIISYILFRSVICSLSNSKMEFSFFSTAAIKNLRMWSFDRSMHGCESLRFVGTETVMPKFKIHPGHKYKDKNWTSWPVSCWNWSLFQRKCNILFTRWHEVQQGAQWCDAKSMFTTFRKCFYSHQQSACFVKYNKSKNFTANRRSWPDITI